MWFLLLSPLERNHDHKGSHMGPSCKYLSKEFPAATQTLTDLCKDNGNYFEGGCGYV
jgi:hypothetical protein